MFRSQQLTLAGFFGLLLAPSTHAEERSTLETLEVAQEDVSFAMHLTMAERLYVAAHRPSPAPNETIAVAVTCSYLLTLPPNHCWIDTINGNGETWNDALAHVLARHLGQPKNLEFSAAAKARLDHKKHMYIGFPLTISSENLAIAELGEAPRPIDLKTDSLQLRWPNINYPSWLTSQPDGVEANIQCDIHADYSVTCTPTHFTPADKADRFDRWLARETLKASAAPLLGDGSSAAGARFETKMVFLPAE